jgi:glycosyltransferase involved in cell wall biosynthesis
MTMRVLRIIARLNVGGPAQHVVWLSEGMAGEGFETLLVTGTVPPGEEDMSAFAAAHGVTPLVIPSMSRELSWRDLTTIVRLWRLMRRFRPDVVHTHTAKAGAVGRIAGLFYRRATYIHTFHGHIFHGYYSKLKTRLFIAIERLLARLNTDRIIVLTEQQRHEIHDVYRVGRPEQFAVIPLGLDLSALPAAGRRQPEMPVIGIVGRLTAIKNHDLFLRVAARMKDEAQFVIFGDGADRPRLERLAAELGLGDRLIFAGTLAPAEIYSAVDVVALTSRNEGTPLALIEAMASGVPVISTAVGGVVDLLGQVEESGDRGYQVRQRGITVASDDIDGFVAGLRRLLADEALRHRVIDLGKRHVETIHSKDRLITDMIALYREHPHHRRRRIHRLPSR